MRKFIIVNTNKNRNIRDAYGNIPWWLRGDYVTHSSGDAGNNIYAANMYFEKSKAETQCKKLQEKFKKHGNYFESDSPWVSTYPYPADCGDADGYEMYAPTYEVKEVELTVEVV